MEYFFPALHSDVSVCTRNEITVLVPRENHLKILYALRHFNVDDNRSVVWRLYTYTTGVYSTKICRSEANFLYFFFLIENAIYGPFKNSVYTYGRAIIRIGIPVL